jgi:long-chain fatty acid transport protein
MFHIPKTVRRVLFKRPVGQASAVLAVCIGFGISPAAATDGYFSNGYGIQAEGLGGASIAYPKDSLAIASNPASALFLGNRFDAGVDYFRPDRGATVTGNQAGFDGSYDGNSRQDFLIPSLGYVRQLSPDLAVGIAAYGNGGLSTAYKSNPFAALGAAGTAGISLEQLFVSPTVAYQIAPEHSIGASVNIGYQRLTVKGLTGPGGAGFDAFSSSPANLSGNGVDEAFGIGARIGYLGHITPRLSIGATYETATSFQDFSGYSGLLANHGAFDTPQNFGVGAAYKVTPQLDVTAEYEFINYSGIPSVGNAALAKLGLGSLGSNNGPGFDWQDANVFRFGANYQVSPQLQVRGGYAYSTEVIRNTETFLNILAPATVQSQFTAGFTWESASRRWEYSGYLLYAPTDKVDGQNSIPGGPKGLGGGNANVQLSEFAVGFSVGYKFDQPSSFKD